MENPEAERRAPFTMNPRLRCCHLLDGVHRACGEWAEYERPALAAQTDRFYCAPHHRIGDVPISGELSYRRVHLQLEVFLAGTESSGSASQQEAFDLLDREVRRLGGIMGSLGVTSHIGRGTFKTPAPRRRAVSGSPEVARTR